MHYLNTVSYTHLDVYKRQSPILSDVSKDDTVTIIENEGSWEKVRTKDGFIGYVKDSALRTPETKNVTRKFNEQKFTSIKKDYKIDVYKRQR